MNVFNNDTPIYLQVKEHIETAILNNDLAENESLPSLRQLAKDFVLNPITISNAINLLEDEGILFKKRGIGVFVEKNAKSKIISKQRNEFLLKTLSQTIEKAKLLEINEEVLINQVKKIYGGGNDK